MSYSEVRSEAIYFYCFIARQVLLLVKQPVILTLKKISKLLTHIFIDNITILWSERVAFPNYSGIRYHVLLRKRIG